MSMTASAVSSLTDWVRPSVIADEAGKLLSQGSGVEDCLEAVINGLEWMGHFGNETAKEWVEDLEPINQGLAVPSFISGLGKLRNDCSAWIYGEKSNDAPFQVFNSALKTVKDGSKSTLFLDTINVISLKESVKMVKGLIWGSIFFLDGASIIEQIGEVENLHEKIKKTTDVDKKNILEHRAQIAYLNVLKAANSIALASIALVSILFASLAQGFLFSPVVFLSMTSSLLVLSFVTHFYEKMADKWDEERKTPLTGKM